MKFPADYTPAFDAVEDIVADMVQIELDRLDPGGWAGTTLPSNAHTRIEAGEVMVRVHIMPGSVMDGVFRYTPVQLEVIADRYATSMKVMRFLEDELTRKFRDGSLVPREDGSKSNVRGFELSETPQALVMVNPDHRMFEATFMVATKKRTP